MKSFLLAAVCGLSIFLTACSEEARELKACQQLLKEDLEAKPETRDTRFLGKVSEAAAMCRGGERAVQFRKMPWVDWSQYWGTGDDKSLPKDYISQKLPAFRGVTGSLVDLERQRVNLIEFNLFDNSGTYKGYVSGGTDARAIKVWPEMRLPKTSPYYQAVGGAGAQGCKGDLIRGRTTTGICNDILNPLMGSAGAPFARNVEFETSFPDLGLNTLTKNRHAGRLGLLTPDPQVISRKLLTRIQSADSKGCNAGFGQPDNSSATGCDYQKAPFFNVLAAYWIQFMTHDWFSHMEEGHNATLYIDTGCTTQLVNGVPTPLTPADVQKLGCRPGDRVDQTLVAQDSPPESFTAGGKTYLARAPKTFANNNTAWWDASQLYGYDETSKKRVKRDPKDPARLRLDPVAGVSGDYLPLLQATDPIQPQWAGQEAAGFPDNWTIGMSFYHNLFAREHNAFVAEFRRQAKEDPTGDSGLRNPSNPAKAIANKDVTPDELFTAARLVVSAMIAKIHTTEWTPQLLYDEPLYKGMNANWSGLLGASQPDVSRALSEVVTRVFGTTQNGSAATKWYSVLASSPGIFGLGSQNRGYDITKPEFTNAGVNHFGSPFNFPEEFVTVYRLHSLVPDLIEYRDSTKDHNQILQKVAVINTFESKATDEMHSRGLANWALSMGRQRLGLLTLHNIPQFMQNIRLPRLDSPGKQIDLAALDLIRDREHGVPRFNEFRRQYGLRQLTGYDDFFPKPLSGCAYATEPLQPCPGTYQQWSQQLREVYGTHVCDASKVITDAQRNEDGTPINDCLGHKNGSVVDNIEDVDTVVGWLSESTRPHGFAISETQFVVFILNASRRLFSDRFFTSGFRPEFYTNLGVKWVNFNGPGDEQWEQGTPNGHKQPVSPLKRVLLRNIPELADELKPVVNVFDPWARARGDYYTLDWKPRPGAESDPAFKK